MKIIIDTHIFLWAIAAPDRLSSKQREALETLSNTIYVSAVSMIELMIKSSLGKLSVDFDPVSIAKESGFELLSFSAEDALPLDTMPLYHKDPFDRMLIAQAINRKYKIMTNDKKFFDYACKCF